MSLVIVHKKLNELNPAKYNPRDITDDAFEGLKESLKKFGMPQPIIFNKKTGNVVGGHQRLKAAGALGWETVPTIEIDISLSEEKALNVTLNNQKISGHFTSGLDALLKEIRIENGDDFFTSLKLGDIEIPPLPEEEQKIENEKADSIPEVAQNELNVQLGDIYQLGEHRLMCGDSTDLATVEKLMNGEKADMVFTDPPYGMNLDASYSNMAQNSSKYKTKRKPYEQVIGDDKQFDAGRLLLMFDYCQEIFLWGADYYCWTLPGNGSWVVWDKREDSLKGINTYGMFGSSFELCWSLNKHSRDIARIVMSGGYMNAHDKMDKRVHPTQKPVSLAEWFFERWGKNKNLIVDLFLGSGSTLIACEKTYRKCYGMELDPHYCSVIIKRWETFTSKKAVKLG